MKKMVTGVVLAMAMLIFAQIGYAAKDDPFRGCDPNAPGKGGIEFVGMVDNETAQFIVRLDPYQEIEQKLVNPRWQMSASYHFLKDKAWQYAYPKNDNYKVETTMKDAETLLITVKVSGSEVGIYNIRFWGEEVSVEPFKPVWINRNHPNCRNSVGGFQGYEVMLNTLKKTSSPVVAASNAPTKK